MKNAISKLKIMMREWQGKLIDHQRYQLSEEETNSVSERISSLLAEIFGYHALLYSSKAKKLVGDNLSVRHSFVLANEPLGDAKNEQPTIVCRYTELPVSSDTIDLIVIPEVLQQVQFPHQILREVERTLIPEGHIILLVENVFSWQSMKNRILTFIAEPHFKTRVISCTRISDWFRLLGLEICREILVSTSDSSPEFFQKKNKENNWLENFINVRKILFSSYYIILAKKKVSTLTPIRPSWRSNQKLVKPRFAEPSVRITVDKILNHK